MKKIFLLLITIVVFIACSNKDEAEDNSDTEFENTSISGNLLEDLELSLNLKEYYDISFSTQNMDVFIEKYSAELLLGEGFYFKGNDKYTVVRISTPEYEQKMLALNAQGFNTENKASKDVTCKTCRNEECVRTTISTAVGDGTSTVYLRVRPVTTLGVRTGVQVCYSSKPIEAQVAPLPFLTAEEAGISPIDPDDYVINIDDLLISTAE